MKKSMIYVVIIAAIIVICICTILIINNGKKVASQTITNVINTNESTNTTDIKMPDNTASGVENSNFDNITEDTLSNTSGE